MSDFNWWDLAKTVGSIYAGNKVGDAAATSAQSNIDAAKIAAEAAKFKPYSISSGFGTSYFDEPNQRAGYEIDPMMKAFRDQMYGGAAQTMSGIEMDPTRAAENYYNQQQALMSGGRGAEDIALRQQQMQQGRIGLGLSGASQGAGEGTGYVNPQQYQMQLARNMSDQQLAAGSQQMAQADIDRLISRGTGLLQTGMGIEQQGQTALTLGADIGNKASAAGAQQGNALLAGGQAAANANLAGGLGYAQMLMQGFGAGGGMFGNNKKQ